MKLRTRLDVFSTALLSALGASSVVACGGTFTSGGGAGGAGNTAGATDDGGATARAGADPGGSNSGGTTTGGATTSGGAPTTGGAATGGGANHFPCQNPKDLGNGLIQCDNFTHRAEATTCASSVPRPEPFPNSSPTAECKQDSDCTEKPNGWCGSFGGMALGPYCIYGCVMDSECSTGQLCLCGDPVGRCVQATDCTSDAACEPGYFCKSYDSSGGCGITTFACQKPADECANDSDCRLSGASGGNLCAYDRTLEHFRCQLGGCNEGRPFLVEGEQRLAPASARADWRELALLPRLSELDAALGAHLAEQWTRIALMEHASIAAFARFSLQLLSLGAPADLIELTTAAMADETKHAKACFALASQYAGAPVGPGRLAVERSLDEMSLEQIVLNTIREGCIGETVAAIEVREAAEHATEPALRALLLEISEDEARHAELAFRFVKWALAEGDATLERAVRREF
ncbi:MAG: ferritin-like domain-containing protein, partial [Polyangiaceae bacterium]